MLTPLAFALFISSTIFATCSSCSGVFGCEPVIEPLIVLVALCMLDLTEPKYSSLATILAVLAISRRSVCLLLSDREQVIRELGLGESALRLSELGLN